MFVNSRSVRDKLIAGAIRGAYADLMPGGRFPALVLFLGCPPERVDVNVHPAKAEVRFRDGGLVRGLIVSAIREALGSKRSADTGLARQVGGALGDLAAHERIGAGVDRLLQEILRGTGAPGNASDRAGQVADQERCARQSELDDPARATVATQVQYQSLITYRPWMGFGATPGHTIARGAGIRLPMYPLKGYSLTVPIADAIAMDCKVWAPRNNEAETRRAEAADLLLRAHIGASKAEVRKITLHMLHEARERSSG
jgi:hypothetical protein